MADVLTKYVSRDTLDNLWHSDKFWRNIVLGAIIAKVSTKLIGVGMEFLIKKSALVLPPEVQHEKDVVYLYVFPRKFAKSVPNISPFAVKVETWLRIYNIKHQFIQKARMQGMGRLPQQQVAKIGKDDIRAVSKYLGNKQYLMGSKPTKIDCSMFGHLSQIVHVDFPYSHKELLDTECTNIMPYMEESGKNTGLTGTK